MDIFSVPSLNIIFYNFKFSFSTVTNNQQQHYSKYMSLCMIIMKYHEKWHTSTLSFGCWKWVLELTLWTFMWRVLFLFIKRTFSASIFSRFFYDLSLFFLCFFITSSGGNLWTLCSFILFYILFYLIPLHI